MTTRVVLTDGVMLAVEAVLAADGLPMVDRFATVLQIVHGIGAWEASAQIDPGATEIPVSQWETICRALVETGRGDGPDYGLAWVNLGPSGFEPEAVTT